MAAFLTHAVLLSGVIASATAALGAGSAADDWDWSYTHSWGLVNTNGRHGAAGVLTDYEANFLANNNDIVGVGGTFGEACGPGVYAHGEAAQAAAAKQLKSHNPNVKVIIYRNSDINIDGQLQACKEFDAHPEWLLRNTTGGVVGTQQWYDFTAPGMSDWWINSTIDALTDICKQARHVFRGRPNPDPVKPSSQNMVRVVHVIRVVRWLARTALSPLYFSPRRRRCALHLEFLPTFSPVLNRPPRSRGRVAPCPSQTPRTARTSTVSSSTALGTARSGLPLGFTSPRARLSRSTKATTRR